MRFDFKGRRALVTASSRGIGKAIATELARQGLQVTLNARVKEDLDVLLSELSKYPAQHAAFCADLSNDRDLEALCTFLEENEPPDIIVHNLGGNLGITDPFCSLEEWQRVMRLNLDVAVALNRRFLPYMIDKKWGRICHISSISALENQGAPSYCAAKAALTAYVRSLGRYVAKEGVVMTSVLPGPVLAEGNYWDESTRNRPEHVEKYLKERVAIGRFGLPQEIADVVAFLCSDHASFCVGSAYVVDGGQGRCFYTQDES